VTLTIKNGPTDEIIQFVREGRVDVGITSVAVKDGLLECLPLLEYSYWLVSARTGSDAGFILPSPGSSLRRRVEAEIGGGQTVVAEVASLEAVPNLVKSGVGSAMLPGYALPRNRKGLRLKRLAHMGTDAVCSLCLKSDFRYSAASKFLAFVQQSFTVSSRS
jgi:DNA-binding transcriptional LysR family regulator